MNSNIASDDNKQINATSSTAVAEKRDPNTMEDDIEIENDPDIVQNFAALEAENFDNEILQEYNPDDTVAIEFDDDDLPPPEDEDDDDVDMMEVEEEEEEMDEEQRYQSAKEAEIDQSECTVNHTDSVLTCAIRPKDDQLEFATGSMDDTAAIWELKDGKAVEKKKLEGHTDSVVIVAYNHTGEFVATASYDGTVKIWNADSGDLIVTCEGPTQEIEWACWHPKGNVIIAGSTDATIWMWWAPTGKTMQVFGGHGGTVSAGNFTAAGKLIATGADDGSVIVWDPKGGMQKHSLINCHQGSTVVCLVPYPDEEKSLIMTGAEDGSCKVISAENGKVLQTLLGHEKSVEAICFNKLDSPLPLFATGDLSGKLAIWDALTFNLRTTVAEAHTEGIVAMKWASGPNVAHLLVTISCASDGISKLWDGRSGACLRTFSGHKGLPTLSLDVRLFGSDIVITTASDDRTCKVFRHTLQ